MLPGGPDQPVPVVAGGCLPATARWGVGAGGQQGACLFSCESARTAATASRRSAFRSRGHAAHILVPLNLKMLL